MVWLGDPLWLGDTEILALRDWLGVSVRLEDREWPWLPVEDWDAL